MKKALQIISIQHELSMAIGSDLTLHAMIKHFMRVAIARLDLSSSHLFLFTDKNKNPAHFNRLKTNDSILHFQSIPVQFLEQHWSDNTYLKNIVAEHLSQPNFFSIYTQNEKTYHCFCLPDHGVIVLESVTELEPIIKKSLQPIFIKLALSCYACIAHEALLREMTARRSAEKVVAHQASHDELTQLCNRRRLTENLIDSIEYCRNNDKFGALIFIDLNQFKSINDVMGHDVGDKILKEVAIRLLSITRTKDTVARFGGDEFIILLPNLGGNHDEAELIVRQSAARIHDAIEESFAIGESNYNIGCSIGFEIYPYGNESPTDIIKNADLAMYEAKAIRQRVALRYDVCMSEKVNNRLHYVTELKNALKNDEFVLHYQPQFNTIGEIIGAEALLRWNNPKRAIESPAIYIPIAEESDLILAIGDWVLNEACTHLKILQDAGLPQTFKKVAVNVSVKQLTQENFFSNICKAIESSRIDARDLAIEITENILISRIQDAITLISKLKTIGVDCAIDDFGTGYSSLTYLKRLQTSVIKIDRSFVKEIHKDAENRSIARMIIALGDNLDMAILAEGVETEDELRCLIELGCDQYQGYYFSKPLPFDAFLTLINNSTQPRR